MTPFGVVVRELTLGDPAWLSSGGATGEPRGFVDKGKVNDLWIPGAAWAPDAPRFGMETEGVTLGLARGSWEASLVGNWEVPSPDWMGSHITGLAQTNSAVVYGREGGMAG